MGGFFGVVSGDDCVSDLFFGVDYHSHLGVRRGGLALFDHEKGFQREIHKIENIPFRTKFEDIFDKVSGNSGIGCISDSGAQPLVFRSSLGTYAICMVGIINNSEDLVGRLLSRQGHFSVRSTGGTINTTELLASLINQKDNFVDGIRFAQEKIDGTASILILTEDGSIIAARDKVGRLPVFIGKGENGYAVSFEPFAYQKLGYEDLKELGPGEIVRVTCDDVQQLAAPHKEKKICGFLWTYYGYPTATYEGVNVEIMRYRNGEIMAQNEIDAGTLPDIDYVGGVPDSGTPNAIGFAQRCGKPFVRAFIKYTPTWSRSFMPYNQKDRKKIANMKQLPVRELIKDRNLLFVDDSIVRGTQLSEVADFLYDNGAKTVHIRSACPPIMFGCKYLNFSRSTSDMDLIGRRVARNLEGIEGDKHLEEYSDGTTQRGKKLRKEICRLSHFASVEYQNLDGVIKAIGLPACDICTYCWNGKE